MSSTPPDPAGPFDLAVIGGGVNGAGIARDAAGRGARVVLIERGDLAQGTSSASTKLIHGGLRYLEHHEFALVREALGERETLWGIAPHIIAPMRFVLPFVPGLRPRWMLRLGLFLYDHIGGRKRLPATEHVDLRRHRAGRPLKPGFRHAYVFSDAWVDDARLVVLNVRDAADRGAAILVRTEVTALMRTGDHWTIGTDGSEGVRRITARAVVNAAGPSVQTLIDRANVEAEDHVRLVRGSHIVVRKLFDHDHAYFFQLPDGRIFFAIPYDHDFTLIGTTDADHEPGEPVEPSDAEIAYLCDAANRYFAQQITPADIVSAYAGVRPLVEDRSGKPEAATRGYRFDVDGGGDVPPILSVFGGKITTYRHLAAEVMAKMAPLLPVLGGKDWTGTAALPGGDFPVDGIGALIDRLAAEYPFLDTRNAGRIARAYGTLAWQWLGQAKVAGDLGEDFGHGLYAAEVDYLIDREWARTAEDVLWRRTKLGLRLAPDRIERLTAHISHRSADLSASRHGPPACR